MYRFQFADFTIRAEAVDYMNNESARWDRITRGAKFTLTANNVVIVRIPSPCRHLIMKRGMATCKLEKRKPRICRVYPQRPEHDYYRVITSNLKVPCGYSFTEDSH